MSSTSRYELVPPPAPNTVARPATLGACQVRLQLSMLLLPRTARLNFCAAKLTSLVALLQLKVPKVVGPWAAFAAWNPATTDRAPRPRSRVEARRPSCRARGAGSAVRRVSPRVASCGCRPVECTPATQSPSLRRVASRLGVARAELGRSSATPGRRPPRSPTRQCIDAGASRAAVDVVDRRRGTAASSPPLVCGSWASVTSSRRRPLRAPRDRRRHEPPVVGRAAGLDAGRGELQRAAGAPAAPPHRTRTARRTPGPSRGRGPAARTRSRRSRPRTPCATRTSEAARLSVRIWSIAPSRSARRSSGPGGAPLTSSRCRAAWSGSARRRAARRPCAAAGPGAPRRSRPARTSAPGRGWCGRRPACRPPRGPWTRRPSKIAASTSRGRSSGNAAIDSAKRTRPPIANTSLSAFAAAISPNVRGSSTSGGKKSSVPMIARSSLIR